MKHLYRIGIFVATALVVLGLYSVLIREFRTEVGDLGTLPEVEKPISEESSLETAGQNETVTKSTIYMVLEYDGYEHTTESMVSRMPAEYVGMNRQELLDLLEIYERSPSLKDVERGLQSVQLESFSSEQICVKKTYFHQPDTDYFYLIVEDHYLVVYYRNLNNLYCYTDILVDELPERVRNEIMRIKTIYSESELYTFLESYSS